MLAAGAEPAEFGDAALQQVSSWADVGLAGGGGGGGGAGTTSSCGSLGGPRLFALPEVSTTAGIADNMQAERAGGGPAGGGAAPPLGRDSPQTFALAFQQGSQQPQQRCEQSARQAAVGPGQAQAPEGEQEQGRCQQHVEDHIEVQQPLPRAPGRPA